MGKEKEISSYEIKQELTKEYNQIVKRTSKPRILLVTPEITALPEGMGNAVNYVAAKGGGLGDISASLVRYLNETNEYDIHIAIPKYDIKIKNVAKFTNQQIDRLAIVLSGRGIHLVNDSAFSYLSNPYEDNLIHSSARRALALQRHVINNLLELVNPDIVHCNDWMTGLIPSAAKAKGIKSLFTLHNIFTEKKTMKDIELSGMKPMEFAEYLYFEEFPENLRQNWKKHFDSNKVDFTASAIFASDYFNTVSKTFLEELVTDKFSDLVPRPIFEMIKQKYENGRALGILNAPNDTVNSKVMGDIVNFNKYEVMEAKAENKRNFQKLMGLPSESEIPLFFWPNRLYYQKSPEILVDNVDYFLKKYNIQIAVVANGNPKIEKQLEILSKKFDRIKFKVFDESLSNLGKAAADFILMPSRYEPCGLPQMEAPRFGTLPVVRATGGLKDTIEQMDVKKEAGNGFLFEMADKPGLEFGIREAIKFYDLPFDIKEKNIQRVISHSKRTFNMKNTASKYMDIYDKLIKQKRDKHSE
ncbi:MAG: glycogen/starch synthase [Candidatus Cloacimonetes bacterium]|nr:glycogen/starch synthase [Candidatus Cloacimonadota bacterium]